jgi:hypothetical protein
MSARIIIITTERERERTRSIDLSFNVPGLKVAAMPRFFSLIKMNEYVQCEVNT